MGRALCLVSPLLVGSCILVVHVCRPGVYMQNCRVYEKSVLCTCRIGVRVHVDVVCFSYKVVQNQPYIYSKPNRRPDVYMQNCRMYVKSVLRTCRIGVIVHVDVVCFSYKVVQNPPSVYSKPNRRPDVFCVHAELPHVR